MKKVQSAKCKAQSNSSKLKTIQYEVNKSLIIDRIAGENRDVRLEVGGGEDLTYLLIATDGVGKKDVSVSLNGRGARAQILGIIVGRTGELAVHTFQHHLVADTQSDLLIKSVMFDDARLSYDGLIKIERQAQRSNAYQRNENLLMSDQAKVDARPELEILANDVRCTHGATIGRMDEEVLFYLMSRGVARKEAERLVIEGFFEPVLERIPDGKIAGNVRLKIQSELTKMRFLNLNQCSFSF